MKPSRGFLVWTTLAVCAVLVLGAMTWLTRSVLAAERDRMKAEIERTAAESRAEIEERTRLALWRMDALGAAIMLRENQIRVRTPFLAKEHPEVLLRFEYRKGGEPTSPGLDPVNSTGNEADLHGNTERRERLKRLKTLLAANPPSNDEWTNLNCAAVHGQDLWNAVPKIAAKEQGYNIVQRMNKNPDELRMDQTYQTNSNTSERAQRAKAVAQAVDSATQNDLDGVNPVVPAAPAPNSIRGVETASFSQGSVNFSALRAVWISGELFLLRQMTQQPPNEWNHGQGVDFNLIQTVQGVWLDSKLLGNQFLREAADLLPNAKLVPVEGIHAAEDPLAMVSFPFRLDRHEPLAAATLPGSPPFGAPLWVAWTAVGLAVLTSTLLVRGVMRLSERRASFVSAVTHELRTPLTTFRLYSDMLETGAVREEKRGHYLRVLSREADRLSHLVENVLAFSRIERGNARSNVREVAAGDLLEQSRERLEARLATAGLTLEMDSSCALRVRVDTAAVEHILFNLIDNAAKYAATGDPPVVAIRAQGAGRFVEITVSDHGPGIQASERGRIFQAFHKSAREAAESMPGVGLGLALSRRLARAQGGELHCAEAAAGARFVLRLPT